MRLGDTIVATIGGDGSPRGIVRVSGPGAFSAVARLTAFFTASPGVQRARIRIAAGELACLALVYQAPRSFSGEDTVELLLPGNRELLRRVAAQVCELEGVRQALPGEFTARAFIHGKLTAEQAEGVGALIAARTQAEHLAAERVLSGAAGAEYRAIADELATALALLEAGIDFTDQDDVVAISSAELRSRLMHVRATMDGLLGHRPRETVSEWPLVVLAGAPNAGKSTLFNALLQRERTVVSDVAGTTRDVIVEVLDLAALGWMPGASFGVTKLRVADLAGLDVAGSPGSGIDRDAQQAARDAIERADVVLWCDPSGRFEQGDARWALQGDRPVVRVRTKSDLAPGDDPVDGVSVCAIDGWRLGALVRAIQDAVGRSRQADGGMLVPRHRQAMLQARNSLDEALAVLGDDDRNPAAAEVVATCLRSALDEVGSIAGRISPDDVIGRIFATFCIGK